MLIQKRMINIKKDQRIDLVRRHRINLIIRKSMYTRPVHRASRRTTARRIPRDNPLHRRRRLVSARLIRLLVNPNNRVTILNVKLVKLQEDLCQRHCLHFAQQSLSRSAESAIVIGRENSPYRLRTQTNERIKLSINETFRSDRSACLTIVYPTIEEEMKGIHVCT